ncbi:hypothetical protein CcrBL47_gp331 [Caulobacter phage BL47]|nr:hypothetical protein CcrBL47_gp331 [Caulobacter phage BL47]
MIDINHPEPVTHGNFALMWSGGAFEVFELRSRFQDGEVQDPILRFHAMEVTDPYPIILNHREILARYDDKDEALFCAEAARAAWASGEDALKELQDEFDRKKKFLTERRDRYARDLAIAGREKIDAGEIKPMTIPLTDRETDQAMEASYRTDAAVESALRNITEVLPPVSEFPGIPDSWYEKPVCKVEWASEDGDPSVGIPGWHGLVLQPDQSGTILGEILADLAQDLGDARVIPGADHSRLENWQRLEAAEAVLKLLTDVLEDQTSTHMRFETSRAALDERVRVLLGFMKVNAEKLLDALAVWEDIVATQKATA